MRDINIDTIDQILIKSDKSIFLPITVFCPSKMKKYLRNVSIKFYRSNIVHLFDLAIFIIFFKLICTIK